MDFHEIQFPARLSFGALGGPERRTHIVELASGYEERRTPWAHSRRRYDAGAAMQSLDDLQDLVAFFEARLGQMHGFRWKDWSDFKSCAPSVVPDFEDQVLGMGDGARHVFALVKTYLSGPQSYARPICKPVAGSVRVGVSGDALVEGEHFDVDTERGTVTLFKAPDVGSQVTAGFEFDVPVRFDTDAIRVSVASFQAGQIPDVPVVEVKL